MVDIARAKAKNAPFNTVEGYPSGQREQTVNLSAQPSEVRILLPPPVKVVRPRAKITLLQLHFGAGGAMWQGSCKQSGRRSMVEPQPSKAVMPGRVRVAAS